ncbi:MAG: substrate-binding periplasmic protein [Gammaproteobacteria bacterium]
MKPRCHGHDFLLKTILAAWLAVMLAAGSPAGRAADLPVLVLNDTNEPPFTTADGRGFLDLVAGEAFRRAGVRLKLVRLPAERGLINANAGLDDGDLTRIAGLEAAYPNLIRVPEKLIDWDFCAFSKQSLPGASWESLRPRSLGLIRGWKIYERQYADAASVVTAEDSAQLFRQLERERIEVALFERWQGLARIKRERLTGVRVVEPSLARREMYIYLHKRHAALVPRIADALRDIKTEGLYDRLYRDKVLTLGEPPAR